MCHARCDDRYCSGECRATAAFLRDKNRGLCGTRESTRRAGPDEPAAEPEVKYPWEEPAERYGLLGAGDCRELDRRREKFDRVTSRREAA